MFLTITRTARGEERMGPDTSGEGFRWELEGTVDRGAQMKGKTRNDKSV